jgi:hypothetical protein
MRVEVAFFDIRISSTNMAEGVVVLLIVLSCDELAGFSGCDGKTDDTAMQETRGARWARSEG